MQNRFLQIHILQSVISFFLKTFPRIIDEICQTKLLVIRQFRKKLCNLCPNDTGSGAQKKDKSFTLPVQIGKEVFRSFRKGTDCPQINHLRSSLVCARKTLCQQSKIIQVPFHSCLPLYETNISDRFRYLNKSFDPYLFSIYTRSSFFFFQCTIVCNGLTSLF